jgi:F0F1-type ATP synthase assembly protein I
MAQLSGQPDPKDVERRKRELLAEARGESKAGTPSSMTGLGMQFVVTLLICLFGGQWLDRKLGTYPWLMIAGMMVGGGLGFWSLIRVSKAAAEEEMKSGKQGPKDS